MHKNLNKFLARRSFEKLNKDGSFIEIFKGDLNNLILDEKALNIYPKAKSVIDVPNTYQMWELLRAENMFDEEIVDLFDLYINFLKTPLTLGMFIPTDSNGDVVEEPSAYSEFCTSTAFEINDWNPVVSNECSVFQDAQERVIFEKWRLVGVRKTSNSQTFYLEDDDDNTIRFANRFVSANGFTIEDIGDLIVLMRLFAAIKKV